MHPPPSPHPSCLPPLPHLTVGPSTHAARAPPRLRPLHRQGSPPSATIVVGQQGPTPLTFPPGMWHGACLPACPRHSACLTQTCPGGVVTIIAFHPSSVPPIILQALPANANTSYSNTRPVFSHPESAAQEHLQPTTPSPARLALPLYGMPRAAHAVPCTPLLYTCFCQRYTRTIPEPFAPLLHPYSCRSHRPPLSSSGPLNCIPRFNTL